MTLLFPAKSFLALQMQLETLTHTKKPQTQQTTKNAEELGYDLSW